MGKYLKLITNSMLLVILIGIVALPAVSTGVMRVETTGHVLSIQDTRITTPAVKTKPVKLNITDSYVIKEKPYVKTITTEDIVVAPETTEPTDTAQETTQSAEIINTDNTQASE